MSPSKSTRESEAARLLRDLVRDVEDFGEPRRHWLVLQKAKAFLARQEGS